MCVRARARVCVCVGGESILTGDHTAVPGAASTRSAAIGPVCALETQILQRICALLPFCMFLEYSCFSFVTPQLVQR